MNKSFLLFKDKTEMGDSVIQVLSDILKSFPFFTGFALAESGWFIGEWLQPMDRPPFTADAGLLGGAVSYLGEKFVEITQLRTNFTSLIIYLSAFGLGFWLNGHYQTLKDLRREAISPMTTGTSSSGS